MKLRFISCTAAVALAIVQIGDVAAQRRGTGVSTVIRPVEEPVDVDETIDATQEQIDESVTGMDDATVTDAERENARDDAGVLEERDNLTAEEFAPPLPEPGPAGEDTGIDSLPGNLPPIEDELPPLTPDEIPDPNTLIPDEVYQPDFPPEVAPPPPVAAENKFEKERRLKIRYEQVKLQALKDASIREMRDKAETARTDEAKRQALRVYYEMLFNKMVSIDPDLKERCDLMERAYMRRIGQYRVEPTIPLSPPPTPEPLGESTAG